MTTYTAAKIKEVKNNLFGTWLEKKFSKVESGAMLFGIFFVVGYVLAQVIINAPKLIHFAVILIK